MADRLRWGVLGAAAIACGAVIPAIQKSRNGTLAAVATRDPARAPGRLAGIAGRIVGYDDLLAAADVDAVYIPLPNALHAEWTVKAAHAGKAVLCEKPLALNAAEAETAVAACARQAVPLMEGLMYRFHPQHARVRDLIAQDAIGEICEVRSHLSVDLMSPVDPGNLRFQPALGGGALLDMGCYVVSIARMIFGGEPERVQAWWRSDAQFGVDVAVAAVLQFSGGRPALVSCSFEANGNGFYTVTGRKGSIEVPRGIILGLGSRAAEALVIRVDADGNRREETLAPVDQYQLMVEAFADAVLAGRPAPLPPSDSVANMKVLDALRKSAREQVPVAV